MVAVYWQTHKQWSQNYLIFILTTLYVPCYHTTPCSISFLKLSNSCYWYGR